MYVIYTAKCPTTVHTYTTNCWYLETIDRKCRPKTVDTDRRQTTTALTDNSYYRSRLPTSVSKLSNGSGQQTADIDRRFRPRLQVITVGLDNQPTQPSQHSTTASHADRPSVPTVELGDRQYFKNSPKECTRLLSLTSKNAKGF